MSGEHEKGRRDPGRRSDPVASPDGLTWVQRSAKVRSAIPSSRYRPPQPPKDDEQRQSRHKRWAPRHATRESAPKTFEGYLRITSYLITIATFLATSIAAATDWITQVDPHIVGKVQLWMSAALGALSLVVGKLAGGTAMKIVLLPTIVLASAGVLLVAQGG
jgi:hypothetical protein